MGRAVVFLFTVAVLLFFFYALGNTQEFLDSTQLFLLSALRLTLWLEIAGGVWYAASLVYRTVAERRLPVVRIVLLLLSLAVCAALLVVLQFVRQWLQS
jgi:hypothetical protein